MYVYKYMYTLHNRNKNLIFRQAPIYIKGAWD